MTVPSVLSFGNNKASNGQFVYGVDENDVSKIKIINTFESDKWELMASTNGLISTEDNSRLIADIFYKEDKNARTINYNSRPLATKSNDSVLKVLPMSSDNQETGLFVDVKQEGARGQYTGVIKFTLQSAP